MSDAEREDEQERHANEDDQKSYRTILEEEIDVGLDELERPARGLFLSGMSAGLDIGFSVLVMATILTFSDGLFNEAVTHILVANAYSIGFVFVVLGRSELFTEHTTLAVLPVLDGKAGIRSVLRLWGIVYVANLTGAAIFAGLASVVGPAMGTAEPAAFARIAENLVGHDWWVILLSGTLAGWMMGLLSWLVTAGKDTTSKIFFVWLVTTSIGLLDLHHSIVGSVEAFAALFLDVVLTPVSAIRFLLLATVGNAIGGTVFVALVKYGHAKSRRLRPRSTLPF